MMTNKTLLPVLVLSMLLAACGDDAAPTAATQPETVSKAETAASTANPNAETLLIGSEISYEPFEFKDVNGQPQGFEIDVMNAIAKAAGMKAKFISSPRNTAIETLNNGTFQVFVSSFSLSPERLEKMDMGKPYLNYERAIVLLDTPKNANVKQIEDLAGKRIATHKSSQSNIDKIKKANATPVLSDSFFLMLGDLAKNKADAAIGDSRIFQYHQGKSNDFKLRWFSTNEEKKDISFAVKKGNTELLSKLNAGLEKIKEDGTLAKLEEKWFGKQAK